MNVLLLLSLLPALASGRVGLVGGKTDVTVEPTYQPVVFAVQAINNLFRAKGDTTLRQLAEIISAQSQVVEGEKLYLTLRLVGAPQDDYCTVDVWYRVWLRDANRLIVTGGPTCSTRGSRRRTPGGVSSRQIPGGVSRPVALGSNPDREVLNALNFAVCAVNDASNDVVFSVLGDTSRVTYTQQVTSGLTYRFYNVPLVTSSCWKEANSCQRTNLWACTVSANPRTTTCDLTVQSQPWLTPAYTLTDKRCIATSVSPGW
ncbi:uncharacterized protein LOC112570149 [Pomacea canaliculata]|uniref:uncharacterized protein LOC112570149 n=1 Tax=Pomacea canaliculata TaxID=400727 RepID=UPI000D73993C|nr:uncharacterized protein LOC112570149 [Pomacea canaliculata]